MIKRMTIKDRAFADKVIKHQAIYPFCSDDGTPPSHEISMAAYLAQPEIACLKPVINGKSVGMFVFVPFNAITYEVHAGTLPRFRGQRTLEGGQEAVAWMFAHTPCRKVVALIPVVNQPALNLARKLGFVREGRLSQSFLLNGKQVDQMIMGINKEDAK